MKDQDHVYKTKTSIYVLEEPHDHGLEDYNTGYSIGRPKVRVRVCVG